MNVQEEIKNVPYLPLFHPDAGKNDDYKSSCSTF